MSRVVHFEIHADDVARARDFYGAVFGWTFQDWSDYAGIPYIGCVTGDDDTQGINGAIMSRPVPGGQPGAPVNGAVLTMGVADYDATHDKAWPQVARSPCPRPRSSAWRGRATTSTARATSSASTSLMPRPGSEPE